MKHLPLTTIAAVLLVGCGKSQQSSIKVEPKSEPPIVKALDISIHDAARDKNIKVLKQHLESGIDVNLKDKFGDTPLHKAALNGHKVIAELLIAEGADVNTMDNLGRTPLTIAIASRDNKWTDINTKQVFQEVADLLRKHGGKTGEELKAEGK